MQLNLKDQRNASWEIDRLQQWSPVGFIVVVVFVCVHVPVVDILKDLKAFPVTSCFPGSPCVHEGARSYQSCMNVTGGDSSWQEVNTILKGK